MSLLSVLIALGCLPVVGWRAARQLSADLPPFGLEALSFGFPWIVALVVVPLVGRATHSLDAGLLGLAAVSLVLLYASRRWRAPATVPGAPRLAFWLVTAGVTAAYAVIAVRYQMHDERALFGHGSMVEQLRNGSYPPFLPPIPGHDVRYHYGFDLLAGAGARAFGLSTDAAIDLLTALMVIFICLSAAALVSALGATRRAPFAAFAIHFGAGLAWLMLAGVPGRHPRCLVQYHHPSCGAELFPTPFLNVFQHPVSAGVPLFLLFVVLLLAWAAAPYRKPGLGALLLLILPALAIAQVVYFALGVLATLFALLITRERRLLRPFLAILAAALLLALLSGGMFTPAKLNDSGLVAFLRRPGFPAPEPWAILRYNLLNLGVGFAALPLIGVWALFAGDPRPLDPFGARPGARPGLAHQLGLRVLVAFAVGGALAPQLLTYTRSWDIVKFPSAAAFALSILWVAVVDEGLGRRGLRWLQRAGRVLLLGSGVLAFVFVAFPLEGQNRLYELGNAPVDPGVAKTIAWWRARGVERGELILVQSNIAPELAVHGGLPVVGSDYDLVTQGLAKSWLDRQDALARRAQANMDPGALTELGVVWLMYSDEELNNLGPEARAQLEAARPLDERAAGGVGSGAFALAASFEGERPERRRRIWRFQGVR